jgi:putative transposase
MRVMFNVTDPVERMHTMTKREGKAELVELKSLLAADGDYLRTMVESIVQATLEAEMTAALGAEKGERTATRLGYRSGYYGRSLITRVGTLELCVPQDRQGRFRLRSLPR